MITEGKYLVLGAAKFQQDLDFLRRQAIANPAAHRQLYGEVLREIERLRFGISDGHHALGAEPGKGDLRDCVTAYVRSDPQRGADYRLVFREMGPGEPGRVARRELLAVKARFGVSGVYAHVCARLSRHPRDRQPGLDRFGDRMPGARASEAQRRAELDTKRAIAHAWAGQRPLASSTPLQSRRPVLAVADQTVGARAAGSVRGERRPGWAVGTGWPGRL